MDAVRQALLDASADRGTSLLRLSRLLGRNDAYLQQFVRRGSPRRLPEREREILCDFLGLPPAALGGSVAAGVPIRRLDVAASAGPGALGDDDPLAGIERFPASLVRDLAADPGRLTLITARGDSMQPTIADGDDILVDTGDRRLTARAGVFVLRLDGAVVVKRLRIAHGVVAVASDNPAAAPIPDLSPADAEVVGRVVWLGRRLA